MRWVAALMLWASCGIVSAAGAQDVAPAGEPDSAELNARRVYGAGRAAFEAGRYEEALAYFEQAYELSDRPRLLYNIGITADRLGMRERAIEALERYLESDPQAVNRVEVETRLSVLREGPSAAPDADEPPSGDRTLAYVSLAAGGVLAAGGIVAVGIGATDYASLSDVPDGTTWPSIRGQYDRAPILVTVGSIAGGLGLAAVAIGIVLLAGDGSEASVEATADGVRITGTF